MSGIFLINKPTGITSRKVVEMLMGKLSLNKAGHAGTLDPLATGLLIITVNEATKINEILLKKDKEYIATVKIGIKTDTGDITGKILEQAECSIDKIALEKVLKTFQKTYQQQVPSYSAKRYKGKRLYEYARKEEIVPTIFQEVTIKELKLLAITSDSFKFKAVVSSGTYIRSLIDDIASKLKIIATMSELTRTRQGVYNLTDAVSLDQANNNDIKPLITALNDYPKIAIAPEKLKNGKLIPNIYHHEKVLFVHQNKPLAIYQIYPKDQKLMKPWKILNNILH